MKKNLCYLSIFIFAFLIAIPMAKAENGYVSDKGGVRFRSNPDATDDTNIITTILYNNNFYISNTNAGTGTGCSDNWYYIYYNGQNGYVCSTYVTITDDSVFDTSYNRPWRSPAEAIMGGAEFISGSYISRGQFTLYLQKFNVNPNGYYQPYNHQYMANLRAPSSQASTNYTKLVNNGLIKTNNDYSTFNFVIPIYNNMPDDTYASGTIKNTNRQTADIQDNAFEDSISIFPDSYKPYLRYMHQQHSNWTFTALNTGLDFTNSYQTEKYSSSIEISSGFCEQNPYTITESGWCIATDAATKFFLDPRNFLSEQYIFMFENLSYSDLYTESIVQNALMNTFMSGISLLDTKNYASIFVEAGKNANVSPLYLVSFALQEVTSNGSTATSGTEFTYQGYTYSGLYNFFNIGASSGAEDPLFAGLVYANGGPGGNHYIYVSDDFLSMLKVTQVGNYVKGYSIGTSISNIVATVGSQATVTVMDSNGNVKNNSDKIGTGYQIQIGNNSGEQKYTYVLYGDLTNDGEINSADLLRMRQHLLETSKLTGADLLGANLNNDGEINSADLLLLRQYLLGIASIEQ